MTKYCIITKDGKIHKRLTIVRGVPQSYGNKTDNITNIELLSDAEKNRRFNIRPLVIEDEGFDPRIQTRTGPTVIVEDNQVREVFVITDKDLDTTRADFIAGLDRILYQKLQDRLGLELINKVLDGIEISQGGLDYRAGLLVSLADFKTQLTSVTTVQELAVVMDKLTWPGETP